MQNFIMASVWYLKRWIRQSAQIKRIFLHLCLALAPLVATAKLRVVATSTDLGALIKEVGGSSISLEVLAKGSQNLHYLETKPSYMVLVNRADLVVANGRGLEGAWLPQILRGARNPKVQKGEVGFLELGSYIQAIEVPEGNLSRSHGDVHPEGNPHWSLDPVRMADAAEEVGRRLGELDPAHADEFAKRAKQTKEHLLERSQEWQKRLTKTGITKVITYHRTLNYFLKRFGIEAFDYLEPKPGIPPSAQHVLGVITRAKENEIKLILVEHFYNLKIAERIAREIPGVTIKPVAAAVSGLPSASNLDALYEQLIVAFEESN